MVGEGRMEVRRDGFGPTVFVDVYGGVRDRHGGHFPASTAALRHRSPHRRRQLQGGAHAASRVGQVDRTAVGTKLLLMNLYNSN